MMLFPMKRRQSIDHLYSLAATPVCLKLRSKTPDLPACVFCSPGVRNGDELGKDIRDMSEGASEAPLASATRASPPTAPSPRASTLVNRHPHSRTFIITTVSGGSDQKIANDREGIVYSSGVRTRNVPLPRAMRSLR